jgi:hypothetical protein
MSGKNKCPHPRPLSRLDELKWGEGRLYQRIIFVKAAIIKTTETLSLFQASNGRGCAVARVRA